MSDYKDAIQAIFEEMVAGKYECEYWDLPQEEQDRLYREAEMAFVDRVADRADYLRKAEVVLKLKADCDSLLSACKLLMSRIDDGTLVRDISKDGEIDWAGKMMEFVKELHQVQEAIWNAEGKQL